MAIIQPILGSLRGSIGDNTFSHNRGGDYVRRRVSPTNPSSTRQQTMRTFLSTLAALWSTTLTSAQRAQWNTWAENQTREGPLGNSINLTGINAYVMLNCHLLDAGDTRIAQRLWHDQRRYGQPGDQVRPQPAPLIQWSPPQQGDDTGNPTRFGVIWSRFFRRHRFLLWRVVI